MDFETCARSKYTDYAALAETVAAILRAAIAASAGTLRLQQVQQRAKAPDSLRKKPEHRGILATRVPGRYRVAKFLRKVARLPARSGHRHATLGGLISSNLFKNRCFQ